MAEERNTMTTDYSKPLPQPVNPEFTSPFWEATKRGELVLPRCRTCSDVFFYPREVCPNCLSSDLEWVAASGKGRVYAYTIVHQPANPAFREETPYVYAMIQLDEGPRMVSNLVDCPHEEISINMPVAAVFDEVTPETTLVKFRPA